MNGLLKSAAVIGCTAAIAVGFGGCDFSKYTGKTAYEIAVENGFTGTEAQWLASLHGADGKDAEDIGIEDLYTAATANGYDGSFLDFLKEYLADSEFSVNENNDTATIAENVMSVVGIYCGFEVTEQAANPWFGGTKTQIECSAGSGVIYSLNKEAGSAYIVTNYHVIYNEDSDNGISDSIWLYLYGARNTFNLATGKDDGGGGMRASFVGGAMRYDVAVLKVEGSEILQNSDARAAESGDSDAVSTGEKVYAIGNAEGEGISVTDGVVSVASETISLAMTDKISYDYRVMRTSAAINSGNSGGALFDADGKLIGITNAKAMDLLAEDQSIHSIDNMGYALPISHVKGVVGNILDNAAAGGKGVLRATLGVNITVSDSKAVLDADAGKVYVKEVCRISSVTSGSAAAKALETGDVLISASLGGETVDIDRSYRLPDFLLGVRKGDVLKLTVERGGRTLTLSVDFSDDSYFTSYD